MVAQSFIPSLGRQTQVGVIEVEVSLVYKASFRTVSGTQRNPVSKNKEKKTKRKRKFEY